MYSLVWEKPTTEFRGKNCIGVGEKGGAREVHQTGEGHVPSMRHCSEVCCGNKRTLCSGSWTPPRIRFQPVPVSRYDGFADGKHQKKAPWQMMFADDVVLCAREKDVLELELEQWREALEKRGMKVSRANTEYMCLNGTPLGSVHMQSALQPQVTEFKYMGSTLHSDGDMNTEINKRTQCGWNNWRKMSGVLCDKRVQPRVKGKILKMIVQPAMLYGMETVPVNSSHV